MTGFRRVLFTSAVVVLLGASTLPSTYNGNGPVYNPAYPFGFGLSYSSTAASVSKVSQSGNSGAWPNTHTPAAKAVEKVRSATRQVTDIPHRWPR